MPDKAIYQAYVVSLLQTHTRYIALDILPYSSSAGRILPMAQELGSSTTPPEPTGDIKAVAVAVAGETAFARARMIGDPVDDPSAVTRRLYAADWRQFVAWCRKAKHIPLPATPATLAAYLLTLAPGLSRGTLGRQRAAIGAMHRQSGLPGPRLDAAARKTLRDTAHRRLHPARRRPAMVGWSVWQPGVRATWRGCAIAHSFFSSSR